MENTEFRNFRGKKVNEKGWAYGCYFYKTNPKKHFIMYEMPNIKNLISEPYIVKTEIHKMSLGQSTGVPISKKGKFLYENDIVKATSSHQSFLGVVTYIKGGFFIVDKNNKKWSIVGLKQGHKLELMGNTFDTDFNNLPL